MRLLFCGDIVGRPGRSAVVSKVPELRKQLSLDFVIANGENAAGGFGITRAICDELFAAGVDVITGGNHMWDQREALTFIDGEPRLLRPLNYPRGTPGRIKSAWATTYTARGVIFGLLGMPWVEEFMKRAPKAAPRHVRHLERARQSVEIFWDDAIAQEMP